MNECVVGCMSECVSVAVCFPDRLEKRFKIMFDVVNFALVVVTTCIHAYIHIRI